MSKETFLKTTASALGFDDCRICRADEPWPASERLEAFIEAGHHGSMAWMETLEMMPQEEKLRCSLEIFVLTYAAGLHQSLGETSMSGVCQLVLQRQRRRQRKSPRGAG